jgi:hypothetical protein
VGSLLFVAPPIGLACLWSSGRYGRDARWALTITSLLFTSFGFLFALAVLLRR